MDSDPSIKKKIWEEYNLIEEEEIYTYKSIFSSKNRRNYEIRNSQRGIIENFN